MFNIFFFSKKKKFYKILLYLYRIEIFEKNMLFLKKKNKK